MKKLAIYVGIPIIIYFALSGHGPDNPVDPIMQIVVVTLAVVWSIAFVVGFYAMIFGAGIRFVRRQWDAGAPRQPQQQQQQLQARQEERWNIDILIDKLRGK
jgi:hypothetical protein